MKAEQTTIADELMLRMVEAIYRRHDASTRCARSLRDSVQAAYGVVNEIVKQRSEGMGECALNAARQAMSAGDADFRHSVSGDAEREKLSCPAFPDN